MKIAGPSTQYTSGKNPTHSSRSNLAKIVKAWSDEEITKMLTVGGYINPENGRITKKSVQDGLVDICEGKPLWNLLETKKQLIRLHESAEVLKAAERERENKKREQRKETAWVDLGTIGTYFGASAIKVGKWLDQLGLRVEQKIQRNESGDFDMLDISNQKKAEQANGGFISKQPSEKAFAMGLAREIMVTNRKKQDIKIVQWNLEIAKAVLLKSGHELDTDRKMMLKGKGRNSDVKIETLDDRAKKMYNDWLKLYRDDKTKAESWKIFDHQPTAVLMRVETIMGKPRYLQDKKYRTDKPW